MSQAATYQINLRVTADVADELDALAAQAHVSRVDVARQLLLEGLQHARRERVLQLYREGKMSKSRAAEMGGVSLWEFMDWLGEAALPAPLTLSEAVEEVRQLVAQGAVVTLRR